MCLIPFISLISPVPLLLNIGGSELFFILLIILLLFGSKKIPELARSLGKGFRQMRDAANEVEEEITRNIREIEESSKLKSE